MPTYRQVIRQYENRLAEKDRDSNVPKVLFYHFAHKEPHQLYLMMDEEVDADLLAQFEEAMDLYMQGYPVQYIKGVETFFGRDFVVNDKVLIPRYETEELVENILYHIDDYFDGDQPLDLVDVGTGSGAIAISLEREESRLRVYATDISEEALEVARENAQRLGAEVTFMQGDMLAPLIEKGLKFDIFVSNPPYIPVNQEIEHVVKDNEPHVLKDRAILAFEMGYDQREAMEKEVRHYFPEDDFVILKDMNGKDRMLFIYHGMPRIDNHK